MDDSDDIGGICSSCDADANDSRQLMTFSFIGGK